ncbi:hypothetical protein MW887_010303 [Aspergillus wentii]|nr:hypothetical protein MW887_010303 [Aspergillus wentii]
MCPTSLSRRRPTSRPYVFSCIDHAQLSERLDIDICAVHDLSYQIPLPSLLIAHIPAIRQSTYIEDVEDVVCFNHREITDLGSHFEHGRENIKLFNCDTADALA